MITHKQYPNHHIFETEIGGRTFTVETGKVAELCNAEAICRYGDTVVLVTAVASPLPKAGIDYFPLTIEVEERMYAVGRIPGSFNRREGKPSDRGVLISRLIDRPMRPLFDEELRNDVVLTNTILAQDYDNPVEIVASIGSSLVIAYSDIPWNGPTATTNVCYLDGKYIVNPSQDERNACECFVTIASTHEKVVMIETEANEVKEDILMECIKLAHETNVHVVEFINTIVDAIGKPKFTFEKAAVNHEMLDDLCEYGLDKIAYALDTDDKNVREARLTEAVVDFKEKFGEKYADDWDVQIDVCLYKMQKKIVKKWLLEGKRVDGRTPDEIRPLDAEVGVLPRVHGSGLFTRGQTQVLSVCTLNTLSAAQKLDTIYDETERRYIHHYNMPQWSTGEARASRSTSRREIGHGALKDGDASGAGSGDLRVVVVRGSRADEAVGALDILGAVADRDLDALGDQLVRGDGGVHVRAGDLHPHAPQHQPQRAHRHAADADQMAVLSGLQILLDMLTGRMFHVWFLQKI